MKNDGVTSPGAAFEIRSDDWVKGNPKAAVRLIEYSDFQCPACGSYYPLVKELAEEYGDRVAFVYRHFPLATIHRNAFSAAIAAEAAGRQGDFWGMHDTLFEKQAAWGESSNPEELFAGYAADLDLDAERFRTDSVDSSLTRVERDAMNGLALNSTPTFFLNGVKIANLRSLEEFKTQIEAALATAPLPEGESGDVHAHFDFALFVNGEQFDFSLPKYQTHATSSATEEAEEVGPHAEEESDVHLHDGNAKIIHIHRSGVTLAEFFSSLGMDLTDACLTLDTGSPLCTGDAHSLKLFVNGARIENSGTYQPKDLDQVLLSYGPLGDNDLEKQRAGVSDEACIYSETCPERGTPPEEACVGGLGTGCEE